MSSDPQTPQLCNSCDVPHLLGGQCTFIADLKAPPTRRETLDEATLDAAIAAVKGAWRTSGLAPESVYVEALETLRQSSAGSASLTWQPMETAPKDGRWIMVVNAHAAEPKPWFVRFADKGWENQQSYWVVAEAFNASHWQEMPSLPASSARREGE